MTLLTVVYYPPGMPPETVVLDEQTTIKTLIGNTISGITTPEGLLILRDDKGIEKGLPANVYLNGLTIFGPVVVTKADDGGNLISMTHSDTVKAYNLKRGDMRC